MKEMLLMAIEASDVLLVFEVLPAYDTFFFPMVKPSSKFEFADGAKDVYLVVEVLKSVEVLE